MKIAVISFSLTGAGLAKRIINGLSGLNTEITGHISERHAEGTGFTPFSSVYELTSQIFDNTDALVFIGACGIAVRAVAPLVKSKLSDPAVVACDEAGQFAVSLLSGHVGGANLLAGQIGGIINAIPVITTASDAPSTHDGLNQKKNLVLGIGCRKGVTAEAIERAATILLHDVKIPISRVCEVATIDVKRDEPGLLGFAKAHKLPLYFFSAAQLAGVTGGFSSSERVLEAVGVDNVCERAAALRGGKGKLIMKKSVRNGVAAAVFEKE